MPIVGTGCQAKRLAADVHVQMVALKCGIRLLQGPTERIENSTAYGEVWHGFWARNHCSFPEFELAQLPNCRIAGRESTFGQPHTQPAAQSI